MRKARLLTICVIALAATAVPASAATTRAEYATQVNAVCATAKAEAERIFDKYFVVSVGGDQSPRKPKLNAKKALRSFSNLFAAFHDLDRRSNDGIAAVAPAPGDEALVASWVQSLRAAHELNVPVIRRTMIALRFLFRANPTTGADDELLTKGERRKLKRLQRRVTVAANAVRVETEKASGIALQLGATECALESSASAVARAALPLAG